jgi:hypothetical protein
MDCKILDNSPRIFKRFAMLAVASVILGAVAYGQVAVSLLDLGPTGSTNPYYAGDTWEIEISAPGYGNQPVSMCDDQGCSPNGYYGNTNSSGGFSLTGSFASNDNGSQTETWYVGSVASNVLTFQVAPLPANCTIEGLESYVEFDTTGTYTWDGSSITLQGNNGGEASLTASTEDGDWVKNGKETPDCSLSDTHGEPAQIAMTQTAQSQYVDDWMFSPSDQAYVVGDWSSWNWMDDPCSPGPVAIYTENLTFAVKSSPTGATANVTSEVELDVYACVYAD